MKNIIAFLFIFLVKIFIINAQQRGCTSNTRCKCEGTAVNCANLTLGDVPDASVYIKTLNLRHNKIVKIGINVFKQMTGLKSLYLEHNRIKVLENNSFDGLVNLEDLSLSFNEIEFIDLRAFEGLSRLTYLYLNYNQIRIIQPRTFYGLYRLQKLFLNNNKISKLKEGLFAGVNHLDTLRLHDNPLVCDCEILWLWEMFANRGSRYRSSNNIFSGKCASPERLGNLFDLSRAQFDCRAPVIESKVKDYEVDLTKDSLRVTMECKASGNPKPVISWAKEGRSLESHDRLEILDNGSLLINDPIEKDLGQYECIARNRMGESRLFFNLVEAQREAFEPVSSDEQNDDFIFKDVDENYEFEDDGFKIPTTPARPSSLRFSILPQDEIVKENDNVKFNCRASSPHHSLHWIKDGEFVADGHRIIIQNGGDLTIRNVDASHEGFYVCVITDGREEKYAQAQLIVNVSPTFTETPQDTETIEGYSIRFKCMVSGKPTPTVRWSKNGVILSKANATEPGKYEFIMNNQILKINNLNRTTDEGFYTCSARNPIKRISTRVKLTINPATRPAFERVTYDQSVFENQKFIELPCFARGDPKPQVLWYKDGYRLVTDRRIFFNPFGLLMVTELRSSDAGVYICKAKNIAGEVMHNFTLTVKNIHNETITDDLINKAVKNAQGDVNKQILETLKHLHDRRRPKSSSDLLALLRFPKERTIQLTLGEEVYERALELIFKYSFNVTYNLTSKDFKLEDIISHRQLQRIADLSGCHRHKRKVNCSQRCLKYRTSDGTCNNLKNPHLGAANTPLRRLLPAEYENGFSTPKGWTPSILHHGYRLPSARIVSSKIISTKKITSDNQFSHMLMQWGQFFDHDLDHTVMAGSLNRFSNGLACKDSCTNEQPCFPIEIDKNDTQRPYYQDMCMEFIRSSAVCGSAETSLLTNQIIQREQINQLTSYIDASNVYGSNDQDAFDIRERITENGQLKVHVTSTYKKGILPFNLDTPIDCQRDNTSLIGCFLAGDYRANEQLALLAMHNVWVRQHNRLAEKLRKINPEWSHEQIYQETRKIVAAQMQHITYAHWLPYILGPTGMRRLGSYRGYNPNVDPSISNEFATAAFRFGHALIQPFSFRLNESFQPVREGHLLLRDSFFSPQRFYHEGGQDPLLRGLFGTPAKLKMPREIMNDELTEKLFHITRTVSQDLAALNIQRARDHGLPGYAAYRNYCNMTNVNSFDDLRREISSPEVRRILKELYGDVRNIDLWPGGILEDVIPGAKLGPLFMCIIVDQMKALRDGDRFWYENPGVFTPSQLAEIKRTSLAKIICENGDNIEYIQRDVFRNAKFPTNMLRCSQIEDISLEPWRNCCQDSATGLCSEPSIYNTNNEAYRISKRSANKYKQNINTSQKRSCIENNKTYLDDERWLRDKCTECICLDGTIKCVYSPLRKDC